jgi:hypothetical protein
MPHWPFILAAYGITLVATIATSVWAWTSARQAEARAAQLTVHE